MGTSLDIVERWRWGEDLSDDRIIKESWAQDGQVEPHSEGEMRFYAIQTRLGRQFLWNVDAQTGSATGTAKKDRLAFETLYVSRDGEQAIVQIWEAASENTTGEVISAHPSSEFCSILSRPSEQAEPVQDEDKRESYRRAVQHFYDAV